MDMLEEMTYKEVDGLLYPQIEMPDETEDLSKLGKYGRMVMNYLKENEPARYKTLMRFGKMYEKMSAVEEEANQLYDQLEMQYLAKHKPQNPSSTMEMWKIREQAKMQAEEVVLHQMSDAIPLESDDTELNRELVKSIHWVLVKEAEYTQASFFRQNGQASIGTIHTEDENNNQFMRQFEQDRKAALAGKYNYLNPKSLQQYQVSISNRCL